MSIAQHARFQQFTEPRQEVCELCGERRFKCGCDDFETFERIPPELILYGQAGDSRK